MSNLLQKSSTAVLPKAKIIPAVIEQAEAPTAPIAHPEPVSKRTPPMGQGDLALPHLPVTQPPAQPAIQPAGIRLARLISLGLHPFLIAPLSIVLVLYLDTGYLLSALGWAGLCAAFVVGPASLYLRQKLKQKRFSDADVSIREQRHGFYLFGAASMIICFAVLLWLDAPQVLIAFFAAALLAVISAAAITRFWTKVSIHAGVMAGATVAVAFYSLPLALTLALCTLLVSWARLALKRHTAPQAALGWVVALVSVAGAFGTLL